MTDLIETLPVVALRGMTILPDMVIHFDVSRERSVKAIEEAMLKDQRIFLVTQKDRTGGKSGTGGSVPDRNYRLVSSRSSRCLTASSGCWQKAWSGRSCPSFTGGSLSGGGSDPL